MHNLLIITQKVDENDDVLGFFHEWIKKFSEKFNKVTVICLKLGEYHLPPNVKVLSLGKEKGLSKPHYLFNFYKYIWREHKNYDFVFSHMNPRYVVLGWPLWRLWHKTISLWYAHGYVPFMLKLADKFTDIAFASTLEGYRLKSKKLRIVGQGIDVNKFKPLSEKPQNSSFKMISIGRISPSKDYETLIKAIETLAASENIQVEIVGGTINPNDADYLKKLKALVRNKGLENAVKFVGPVANKDIVPLLQSADLFVNMGHTGSLDKANLEAMACGLPVLTCNEAFVNILGGLGDLLMYPKRDVQKLAEKILHIMKISAPERDKISQQLRSIVVQGHNLEGLVEKITGILLSNAPT